ncbi:F-box domain cyclin-containing protein [Lasiodiplodia theobromae]|uniref:F-box domain cyclin-containing protein n=1 Tax=Lasiodiplodia theobromae TaxID=45133 RepID=UPI0015C2DE5D|nr:F-box domain cyclin-containing protein [Lasiodiplodia theobromae]KAF4543505.1 F-box domain cyclin-containing protein [Lasiodiplodia theobromae]
MLLEFLATELVAQVYFHLTSVNDVLALSATCHRFRGIYLSSRKIPILEHAAEEQYGPLLDVTQLLTHNSSQPAHLIRTVPLSIAFIKQIVHVGRVAERWADLYPFKKWKYNFENRRLLSEAERRRVRRALYRLWLYARAFYNRAHPRETRMSRPVLLERAALLHNWSTWELAEMADVHAVLRDVVHGNVCPSNGTIARRFKKRFPDKDQNQLLFNIHLNYPPPVTNPFSSPFHSSPNALSNYYQHVGPHDNRLHYSKYTATAYHEPGAEGWGDDIPHYYVVEDMMKLDPEQILWLKDNAPLKGQVEMFVRGIGDWFENNGETWSQTLQWVLNERGEDVDEVLNGIAECEFGIAVVEE